ncbi:aminodeoxychorismate lyase [Halomonas sp. V046]|uniref:aminodeoxychorismate lyase n=1 Tax=Halomonas sp. V046 TaxID=3459611 RepID=UPI0040450B34
MTKAIAADGMPSDGPGGDDGLPFDDRGLAYGDGLFETVLIRDGRPVLWPEHLARLEWGCRVLGMPPPPRGELEGIFSHLAPGLLVLKIVYTRGSGGRGYALPDDTVPRLRWRAFPFAPQPQRWREGVRVRLCEMTLSRQPRLAGIKHLARLENVLARAEWSDPEVAEGLVGDGEGRIVEATSMNLFWCDADGAPMTPGLEACGVAGTLRQSLIDGAQVAVGTLPRARLGHCRALWVGNSVQGVWPVRRLEDETGALLGDWSIGEVHRALQRQAHARLGYPEV